MAIRSTCRAAAASSAAISAAVMNSMSSAEKSSPASSRASRSKATRAGPKRAGQPAGQLGQGRSELLLALGVDHAQHRFGLGQVDAAGQKRPQGEFARGGRPGTVATKFARRPRPTAAGNRACAIRRPADACSSAVGHR